MASLGDCAHTELRGLMEAIGRYQPGGKADTIPRAFPDLLFFSGIRKRKGNKVSG